jgi:hypothetical protein
MNRSVAWLLPRTRNQPFGSIEHLKRIADDGLATPSLGQQGVCNQTCALA